MNRWLSLDNYLCQRQLHEIQPVSMQQSQSGGCLPVSIPVKNKWVNRKEVPLTIKLGMTSRGCKRSWNGTRIPGTFTGIFRVNVKDQCDQYSHDCTLHTGQHHERLSCKRSKYTRWRVLDITARKYQRRRHRFWPRCVSFPWYWHRLRGFHSTLTTPCCC